jgi:uncharacterized membrane protein YeaQ/YmgE (transglycosylase-associated protein family)
MQMYGFIFAAVPSFHIIPSSGIMNTIFHRTDLSIQIVGWPTPAYHINLIQLIILIVLAVVVNFVTEFLTKNKSGLVTGVILTVIGAAIFESFAHLPFDFAIENVLVLASLIGAIIVGVFYTLIRARFGGSKK